MFDYIEELCDLYKKAAEEYFFDTKMKINELVIRELAKKTGREPLNVMENIMESPIHTRIQMLAEAIKEEVDKLSAS